MKDCLKVKTYPQANEGNVVYFKDYRITVLQSRLFRIEKDAEKLFCDKATQIVWYRNMPKQKFETLEEDGKLLITTEDCKLIVTDVYEDIRVVIDGESKKISNEGNLGGTYRTLDCCNGDEFCPPSTKTGRITLGTGVCSKTGVAFFEDDSLILSDNGMVEERRSQEKDVYLFAYGKDYRAAVNALYTITGKPPVIPRFAFGNWWSRYHEYTEEEYLRVIERFFERDIPLTVATVDMDWHYSIHLDEQKKITESGKNTDYFGGNNGWTGYSWNKDLFPNYKAFLKKLKKKYLKVTLNLHPSLGIRWFEDCYEEMAKAVGIDPATQKQIEFDMTDEKFIDAYFDVVHRPYEKDGVDFWWIDWQQGESSKIAGFDPLWALNHYHYYDNAENHSSPLILSRYSGIGAHRYPLGFSGDTLTTFTSLDYLPYFTSTASNVGYTYWSHDIGGHYGGEKDNELYLRCVQYAVFNPILRLHCECAPVSTKEPWYYGAQGAIAEKFLKLRHSLVPFLYSASHVTNQSGYALCEPLYYYCPHDERAYKYKNEYVFGQQLLVAPITSHTKNGYASVKAFLPKGIWTDIFTGQVYNGNKEYEFLRNCESIPVLAKEGAIITYSEDKGNVCGNPQNLRVDVYDGTSSYKFYEDDAVTNFFVNSTDSYLELIVKGEGTSFKRKLKILFKNVENGKIKLYKNGKRVNYSKIYADCTGLAINSFDFNAEYKVIVERRKPNMLDIKKREVITNLMKIEGDSAYRLSVYQEVEKCKNIKELRDTVKQSKFKGIVKRYLSEGV